MQTGREQQLTDPVGTAVSGMRGLGRVDGGLGRLVELDRHDHAGQDDDVGEREHRQAGGYRTCGSPFKS